MPRANRHFLAGYIWHITHRCHRRQFLLKFARDRRRWMHWLFEARRRYGLCVLNFIVTSNHIHLLARDGGNDEIVRSMQLIASRTGQEYNRRKQRQGAYWQDRYHATAVESDRYLARCFTYIDMNMVRTGKVTHPAAWPFSGYAEIQQPRQRYRLIDYSALCEVLDCRDLETVQQWQAKAVDEALAQRRAQREAWWSESVAVGGEAFVQQFQAAFAATGMRRTRAVTSDGTMCLLNDARSPYDAFSGIKWSV